MWIRLGADGWWRVLYRDGSATKPMFSGYWSAYAFALAIGTAPDDIA